MNHNNTKEARNYMFYNINVTFCYKIFGGIYKNSYLCSDLKQSFLP